VAANRPLSTNIEVKVPASGLILLILFQVKALRFITKLISFLMQIYQLHTDAFIYYLVSLVFEFFFIVLIDLKIILQS